MVLQALLLGFLCFWLWGCSSKSDDVDQGMTETELYSMAQEATSNNNYPESIRYLKALESRFPFGRYAEQAQLELAYAYYKNGEPEAARSAADRFLKLHPEHTDADYAYYIRGLTSFNQDRGFLSNVVSLDMSQRDPGAARDSFADFAQLTLRYPESRYAPDAKQRMIYLKNLLAAYEIHVGRFYLKRKAYVAAVNRGRYVVENYEGTPAVSDGLAVMAEGYRQLKMDDLYNASLQVLKSNYPDYPQLQNGEFVSGYDDYSDRNWISKSTLNIIDSNDDPLPPRQSQASRDIINQYKDATEDIPEDLLPGEDNAQVMEQNEDDNFEINAGESFFRRSTLGIFD